MLGPRRQSERSVDPRHRRTQPRPPHYRGARPRSPPDPERDRTRDCRSAARPCRGGGWAKSLGHARLPVQRTPPPVSYSQDGDDVAMDQEDDGIRKSSQKRAANTGSAAYLGERRRLLRHAGETRPDSGHELCAQAVTAGIVPACCFAQLLRAARWKRSSELTSSVRPTARPARAATVHRRSRRAARCPLDD